MNQQKLIMIVDDDQTFLEQFEEMLDLSGYDTEAYTNGDQALDALNTHVPDLILMDLKMDNKNGFDVIRVIRKDRRITDVPIVLMSAFFNHYPVKELQKELDIHRCLAKPIKPLDVISEIEAVLN
jgi:CheY-like chemotaxis protein